MCVRSFTCVQWLCVCSFVCTSWLIGVCVCVCVCAHSSMCVHLFIGVQWLCVCSFVCRSWVFERYAWGWCRTYELVMSHIWMSHVAHRNDVAHMNESCCTYERVISHIWKGQGTRTHMHTYIHTSSLCGCNLRGPCTTAPTRMSHRSDTCHTSANIHVCLYIQTCVTDLTHVTHVTHLTHHRSDTCHTSQWVTHLTHVTDLTHVTHVTHLNDSCHTSANIHVCLYIQRGHAPPHLYQWVMAHMSMSHVPQIKIYMCTST